MNKIITSFFYILLPCILDYYLSSIYLMLTASVSYVLLFWVKQGENLRLKLKCPLVLGEKSAIFRQQQKKNRETRVFRGRWSL